MKAELLKIHAQNVVHPFHGWTRLAGHSHTFRAGLHGVETVKENLVAWSRRCHIDALGLGSPWEPVSARHYHVCETAQRDAYYGGAIPPDSVMDREAIAAFLDDLNRRAQGGTFFYLDNETPKNRYGHLWYVGYDYHVPAWHDYSQDRRVAFWDGEHTDDFNAVTGLPHRRRGYMEVVAQQRAAGALAIWAHPTSWWRDEAGGFVTNIAADMVPQLHADGRLDGMTVQGYDAFHRGYQALWFHLLDFGFQIPGYSEMDVLTDGELDALRHVLLNAIPAQREAGQGVDALIPPLRAARHAMSSGPFLSLTVDGHPTGDALEGRAFKAVVAAYPAPGEASLGHVQLLGRGGEVLADVKNFTGGLLEFGVETAGRGYLVARAVGEYDTLDAPQKRIAHCALTNPVYLNPWHITPLATRLILPAPRSPGHDGATFRVLTAAGEPLECGTLSHAEIQLDVPASARLEVACADGRLRDIPLSMANPSVRRHMDYLADGLFLNDHPNLSPGEVPLEAFRCEAIRDAMQELRLTL